jgi:hypothetical protein
LAINPTSSSAMMLTSIRIDSGPDSSSAAGPAACDADGSIVPRGFARQRPVVPGLRGIGAHGRGPDAITPANIACVGSGGHCGVMPRDYAISAAEVAMFKRGCRGK